MQFFARGGENATTKPKKKHGKHWSGTRNIKRDKPGLQKVAEKKTGGNVNRVNS